MQRNLRYSPNDKLSSLIDDNFMILNVMSRFQMSLGFGDSTVRDVCESQGIDCDTFLAVADFISNNATVYSPDELPVISLSALISYLENAHSYFLEFSLPMIKRKFIEAISSTPQSDVVVLILKYYDNMTQEVTRHMEIENTTVFAYAKKLLGGIKDPSFSIINYAKKHTHISEKLSELKNIIIKYYPEKGDNILLNAVLFDIYNCELDLLSHCHVEDCLFVPAVINLERSLENEK